MLWFKAKMYKGQGSPACICRICFYQVVELVTQSLQMQGNYESSEVVSFLYKDHPFYVGLLLGLKHGPASIQPRAVVLTRKMVVCFMNS